MKNPHKTATLLAITAVTCTAVINTAKAQLVPPTPPIPFEINNAAFSGTVNVASPIALTNPNNELYPVGTIIAPVTFSGTVSDIDNITQTYSRRTKLWTLNYIGGTSSVTSATIVANIVLSDTMGEGPIDTSVNGWTFAATVEPNSGSLGPLELLKITNNVVANSAPSPGILMNIYPNPALRSGSISYRADGSVAGMTAVSRDAVDVQVSPEAYTYSGDPDAATFYLFGVSSNTYGLRTNVFTYPDGEGGTFKETNIWTSVSGVIPVNGLGTGSGGAPVE